jgi:hypothetical protein
VIDLATNDMEVLAEDALAKEDRLRSLSGRYPRE